MPFRKRLFSSPIHGPWKRSDVCRNLRAGKVASFLFFFFFFYNSLPFSLSVLCLCSLQPLRSRVNVLFLYQRRTFIEGKLIDIRGNSIFYSKKKKRKKETEGKEGRSRFWSLLRINTRCHRIRLYVHRFERSRQQQIRLTSRFYLSQGNVKSIQISEVESYTRYTTPKGAELMLRSSQTIGKSFYRSPNRLYWINSATIWLTSPT